MELKKSNGQNIILQKLEQSKKALEESRQKLEKRRTYLNLKYGKKNLNDTSFVKIQKNVNDLRINFTNKLKNLSNASVDSLISLTPQEYVDNLRFKLELYYKFYKIVIYLMKGLRAKYRHTFLTKESIEASCAYLKIVNNNFYSLFQFPDYRKLINNDDIIQIYQIAIDTNDNQLKTKINTQITNKNLKLKLTKFKPFSNTLKYTTGVIANIIGKASSSTATVVEYLVTGFLSIIVEATAESSTGQLFTFGYQDIINEYDTKITYFYKNIKGVLGKLQISGEINNNAGKVPKQSWLLNTEEKMHALQLAFFFENCFYTSDPELLIFIDQLKFKNDKEIYDFLSREYSMSYKDSKYKEINQSIGHYFPSFNKLEFDPDLFIVLLKICNCIYYKRRAKDNIIYYDKNFYNYIVLSINKFDERFNYYFSINQENIQTISKDDFLIKKEKVSEKVSEKIQLLQTLNNPSIIDRISKIIKNNDKELFVEINSKITNKNYLKKKKKYILKIQNEQEYNNLKIIKNIIINKIINYFIRNKETKLCELYKFLNYLSKVNWKPDNEAVPLKIIISSINFYKPTFFENCKSLS